MGWGGLRPKARFAWGWACLELLVGEVDLRVGAAEGGERGLGAERRQATGAHGPKAG